MPRRADLQKAVGSRLRYFRRTLRLSRANLGAMVGRSGTQIEKYELGKDSISASQLYKISIALRIPVSALFEGADEARNTSNAGQCLHDEATPHESADNHRDLLITLNKIENVSVLQALRVFICALPCGDEC